MIKNISISMARSVVMSQLQPLIIYGTNVNQINQYNIEHIVPQSMDRKVNCDLHMIFMSDREINRIRSNYRFVNMDQRRIYNYISYDRGSYYLSKNKSNYYCAFSNQYRLFVPPENSKGLIARSLLYYQDTYKNESVLNKIIDTRLLLKWHHSYQVTLMEYERNEEIFDIQKNRNSYIYFG